jgi:hypothetical protein
VNTGHETIGPPAVARARSALRQIKAFVKGPDFDCACSSVVGEVLLNLAPKERAAVVGELVVSAVRQRTKLITLMELLMELDELGPATDRGEIEEAAMIFDGLAEQARLGSQLLRAYSFYRSNLRQAAQGAELPATGASA